MPVSRAAARIVIDPSVAIKWYIPEDHADLAVELKQWLLEGPHRVIVPPLFFDEMANILWKKETLRKEHSPRTSQEILWEILRLPLHVYLDRHEMLPKAVEVARAGRVSVYDAIYVATAIQNQAVFITADERLVRRLAPTSFATAVLSLENWTKLKSDRFD